MADSKLSMEDFKYLILNPSTTPSHILESLSNLPFPPPEHSDLFVTSDSNENVECIGIFFLYLDYIIRKRPNGKVDGATEDIFRKCLPYTKNASNSLMKDLNDSLKVAIPAKICSWLKRALSAPIKCPNPYVRLDLFRLVRLVKGISNGKSWEFCQHLGPLFIQTLSEIKPQRLLKVEGLRDEALFDIYDLLYT